LDLFTSLVLEVRFLEIFGEVASLSDGVEYAVVDGDMGLKSTASGDSDSLESYAEGVFQYSVLSTARGLVLMFSSVNNGVHSEEGIEK